jgi:SAM-dependent methyltransferase
METESKFLKMARNFPEMGRIEIGIFPYLRPMWLSAREWYIRWFGYSMPCREAVDSLKRLLAGSRVVDAGAGTGYWSAIIRHYVPDVTVVACDNRFGRFKRRFRRGKMRMFGIRPVRVRNVNAIQMIQPDTDVFMSWPMYQSYFGYKVAKAVSPGRLLVLISEGRGGCCGNDKMFDYLAAEYDEIETVIIPTFDGIHDYMQVLKKK